MYRLAGLALAVIAGCGGCATRVPIEETAVFQPRAALVPETFDAANATFEELRVPTSDGVELYAWHITREGAERTVLYFGGQGFYLVLAHDFVADMLAHVPVNLVLFDYRGYGRSGGEPTVAALKHDALRMYALVTEERGVAPEDLLVHGHSMGSFMASHVAAERPVAGLVLESAVTDLQGLTKELVPGLLRPFVRFDIAPVLQAESNLERVARIRAPTLFLVGSEDRVAPRALTDALHEASAASPKVKVIVEGGGHNELHREQAYTRAYTDFATQR